MDSHKKYFSLNFENNIIEIDSHEFRKRLIFMNHKTDMDDTLINKKKDLAYQNKKMECSRFEITRTRNNPIKKL